MALIQKKSQSSSLDKKDTTAKTLPDQSKGNSNADQQLNP